jgi:hypothetical protein
MRRIFTETHACTMPHVTVRQRYTPIVFRHQLTVRITTEAYYEAKHRVLVVDSRAVAVRYGAEIDDALPEGIRADRLLITHETEAAAIRTAVCRADAWLEYVQAQLPAEDRRDDAAIIAEAVATGTVFFDG